MKIKIKQFSFEINNISITNGKALTRKRSGTASEFCSMFQAMVALFFVGQIQNRARD